jgi:chaperonin cofactor prefoldin
MYRRVGLTTHTGSTGQARQQPANVNEERAYKVSDDHSDITVQRRLAGLTEGAMHFPNPSGATRLRAPNGEGILDINSTLEAIGLPRNTPRVFESRTSGEMKQAKLAKRIAALREQKKKLLSELRVLNEELDRAESVRLTEGRVELFEDGAKLADGVEVAKVRGGYVLIRERQDGSWVGLGKRKSRYTGTRESVLEAMTKDAQEKFPKIKDAISVFDSYYKYARPFMGVHVAK